MTELKLTADQTNIKNHLQGLGYWVDGKSFDENLATGAVNFAASRNIDLGKPPVLNQDVIKKFELELEKIATTKVSQLSSDTQLDVLKYTAQNPDDSTSLYVSGVKAQLGEEDLGKRAGALAKLVEERKEFSNALSNYVKTKSESKLTLNGATPAPEKKPDTQTTKDNGATGALMTAMGLGEFAKSNPEMMAMLNQFLNPILGMIEPFIQQATGHSLADFIGINNAPPPSQNKLSFNAAASPTKTTNPDKTTELATKFEAVFKGLFDTLPKQEDIKKLSFEIKGENNVCLEITDGNNKSNKYEIETTNNGNTVEVRGPGNKTVKINLDQEKKTLTMTGNGVTHTVDYNDLTNLTTLGLEASPVSGATTVPPAAAPLATTDSSQTDEILNLSDNASFQATVMSTNSQVLENFFNELFQMIETQPLLSNTPTSSSFNNSASTIQSAPNIQSPAPAQNTAQPPVNRNLPKL